VFEADTFTRLIRQPVADETELTPGSYHLDPKTQKLSISTTDFRPASKKCQAIFFKPSAVIFIASVCALRPTNIFIAGNGRDVFHGSEFSVWFEGSTGTSATDRRTCRARGKFQLFGTS